MSDGIFEVTKEGYLPGEDAAGPWSNQLLHGGPPMGLLAHAMECEADPALQAARINCDLMRPVPMAKLKVEVKALRKGQRMQLFEATLHASGVTVCQARTLWVKPVAEDIIQKKGRTLTTMPDPESLPAVEMTLAGPTGKQRHSQTGFHRKVEYRPVSGQFGTGAGAAWLRLPVDLIAGQKISAFVRVASLADFANGFAQLYVNERMGSINADVNLSLSRMPIGEWLGLDATASMSDAGVGIVTARVFDTHGEIGVITQSIMPAPLPS